MLPPQLSEQLCSLQPGEERLAFSAFFTIDKEGNVISTEFARTIIKWVIAMPSWNEADAQIVCQAVVW
jgi:exoribonuclease R